MRYKRTRNEVCSAISEAKLDFELKLSEKMKEDPESFYAYARSKSKGRNWIFVVEG